jgi:hypothetical protein
LRAERSPSLAAATRPSRSFPASLIAARGPGVTRGGGTGRIGLDVDTGSTAGRTDVPDEVR